MRFRHTEITCAQIKQRESEAVFHGIDGHEEVALVRMEQIIFQNRTRRDDLYNVALHKPLGQFRILHLLRDGNFVAAFQNPPNIRLDGMIRHAAHRHARTCRQHHVHQRSRRLRVFEEQFIKIPHAKQQDRVRRQFAFGLHVLPHRGGQFTWCATHFLTINIPRVLPTVALP